jgi:hypothetical protein
MSGVTEKSHEKPVRIGSLQAEILTQGISNPKECHPLDCVLERSMTWIVEK